MFEPCFQWIARGWRFQTDRGTPNASHSPPFSFALLCRNLTQPVTGLELPAGKSNGIAMRFLVDLQRLMACKKVASQEHLVSTSLGTDLKTIVSKSRIYSPRVNLLFRSNTKLRRMFECYRTLGYFCGCQVQG